MKIFLNFLRRSYFPQDFHFSRLQNISVLTMTRNSEWWVRPGTIACIYGWFSSASLKHRLALHDKKNFVLMRNYTLIERIRFRLFYRPLVDTERYNWCYEATQPISTDVNKKWWPIKVKITLTCYAFNISSAFRSSSNGTTLVYEAHKKVLEITNWILIVIIAWK